MIAREHQCGHIAAGDQPSAAYAKDRADGTAIITLCAVCAAWSWRIRILTKQGYALLVDGPAVPPTPQDGDT